MYKGGERASARRVVSAARGTAALAGSLWLAACAVDLDPEPPAPGAPSPRTPTSSCLPFTEWLEEAGARVVSSTLPDGRALVLVTGARRGGPPRVGAFVGPSLAGCFDGLRETTVTLSVAALGRPLDLEPLSMVRRGDELFLYFRAHEPSSGESWGLGVARWYGAGFSGATLLWTADRPLYGTGAVLEGDHVWVYGGRDARFLSADVHLARAPADRLEQPAAYEYWAGGGNWSPDPDASVALAEGGVEPSVTYDATRRRWLMAYVTPLGGELWMRSGLGPAGPWSRPYVFSSCSRPEVDPGSFCSHAVFHDLLDAEGLVALTHGVGTFERPPGATARDYWPRLVRAPWLDALP